MTLRAFRTFAIVATVAFTLAVGACAARGARNKTRVSALAAVDAAIAVSQAETTLYSAQLYSPQVHSTLKDAIVKVLYASRAFERAAAQWQSGQTAPATVDAAKVAADLAIADLEKVIPATSNVREPLLRALAVLRAALTVQTAEVQRDAVVRAESLPAGGIMQLFALLQMLGGLVATGRSSWGSIINGIKALAKKEGATDEELAAADVRATAEIDRKEHEA